MKLQTVSLKDSGLLSAFTRAHPKAPTICPEQALRQTSVHVTPGTRDALVQLDKLTKQHLGCRLRVVRGQEEMLHLKKRRDDWLMWAHSMHPRPGQTGYASRAMSPFWAPDPQHDPMRVGLGVELNLSAMAAGSDWSEAAWIMRFNQLAIGAGFDLPFGGVQCLRHPAAGVLYHWGPLGLTMWALELRPLTANARLPREVIVACVAILMGMGRTHNGVQRYIQARMVLGQLAASYPDGVLAGPWRHTIATHFEIEDMHDIQAIAKALEANAVGVEQAEQL